MRISDTIRGRVDGELKAPIPESFLNRCREEGLPLYDVTRCDACTLRFSVEESGWTAVERAAEKCQAELRLLETRGGSRERRLLRRRSVLLLTLCAAAALLLWSNFHIWRFEVAGCETLTPGKVLRALEDCGVSEGCWWPGLSTDAIRTEMLLRLPDLAWMTVNVNGSRALVSVVERQEKPDIYTENDAADIIAAKNGIIRKLTVLNGRALVSRGSAVIEGELLVTGAMDSLSHPTRYVRAQAEILADTWYEWMAVEPLPEGYKTESLKSCSRFALQFGKTRLNLFGRSRKALDGYDKIVHEYSIGAEGLFVLPIRLIREEYLLYARSEEPARTDEGGARLEQRLRESIDGSVVQVRTETFEKNGCRYIDLRAQCLENLAQTAEIEKP